MFKTIGIGMNEIVSKHSDGEYEAVFTTPGAMARDIVARSSMTLVTFGCAAAVALALVGAAYAVDAPAPAGDPALKGDRIAESVLSNATLTVQDVNPDAGISNLIIVDAEPDRS
jgi:hypothetical protein